MNNILPNMKKRVAIRDNDYYEVILSIFNIVNNPYVTYDTESIEKIFKDNSDFINRVENGLVLGEIGAINDSLLVSTASGMISIDEDYIEDDKLDRLITICLANTCFVIKKVWIDYDYVKNTLDMPNNAVVIKGLIKPTGPYGPVLKEALDTPGMFPEFAMRAIVSISKEDEKRKRSLTKIITWDYSYCINTL